MGSIRYQLHLHNIDNFRCILSLQNRDAKCKIMIYRGCIVFAIPTQSTKRCSIEPCVVPSFSIKVLVILSQLFYQDQIYSNWFTICNGYLYHDSTFRFTTPRTTVLNPARRLREGCTLSITHMQSSGACSNNGFTLETWWLFMFEKQSIREQQIPFAPVSVLVNGSDIVISQQQIALPRNDLHSFKGYV